MTEEQDRIEDEIEQIHHANERKQQMYKGKLFLLLSALSLGKEIKVDREKTTIDALFKELQELAHQLPKTIAMASSTSAGVPRTRNRTPEQPDRAIATASLTPSTASLQPLASGSGNIDHSRLPPEVAACLARTPRTIVGDYQSNPNLHGQAPLRNSPRGRSKSRDRSLIAAMKASA